MSDRPTYHHGHLRQALVERGLERLEQSGLESLSLRGLADDLGVSKTAPYRHFATKTDLLAGMAAEGYQQFADMLESWEKRLLRMSRPNRIRRIYRIYGDFARGRPELYRLMFSRLGNSLHSERCRTNAGRAFDVLIRISASLLPGPSADPRPVALSLYAALHGWTMILLDNLIPPESGVDWSNWREMALAPDVDAGVLR